MHALIHIPVDLAGGVGVQGEVVQARMSLEYDMNLECVQKETYRNTEGI